MDTTFRPTTPTPTASPRSTGFRFRAIVDPQRGPIVAVRVPLH